MTLEATAKTIDRDRVADLTEREQAKLADRTPESRRRYERGVKVMPGGVPSSFQVNDPWPVYLERGDGARVWDVDGSEYVDFHNANTAFVPSIETVPWNPDVRKGAPVMGGSEPLQVGAVRDIPLSKCTMRTFTPEGAPPAQGWPAFIFFHGGD